MKGIVRNPGLVLVLTIVTCGIYMLYWLYVVSNELKAYLQKDDINPGLDLLLSILCAPYIIYWFYKYGKLTYEAELRAAVPAPSDNAMLYLILAIFGFSFVSVLLMQDRLNGVWNADNRPMYQ